MVVPTDALPSTARSIALLLASTPTIQDAQPGVLHQLLEFSHRYTSQVLSDALVYAEHAGRPGKIEADDVTLAIQARVGWELGGRVPKEYINSLAQQVNSLPLPPIPEVFGIRAPPLEQCLITPVFEIVPNKPPPTVQNFDEIEEVIESSGSSEGSPSPSPPPQRTALPSVPPPNPRTAFEGPRPVAAYGAADDVDMNNGSEEEAEASDPGAGDDLFEEQEDSAEGEQPPEPTSTVAPATKRKLIEDDDYD